MLLSALWSKQIMTDLELAQAVRSCGSEADAVKLITSDRLALNSWAVEQVLDFCAHVPAHVAGRIRPDLIFALRAGPKG